MNQRLRSRVIQNPGFLQFLVDNGQQQLLDDLESQFDAFREKASADRLDRLPREQLEQQKAEIEAALAKKV